ncbi:hypothetical protein HOY80DRAFT_1046497 [Tuber brumale]|nr:hypothetical protein HOY80DRAFT_1046497 [Tuber brumale]
MTWFCRYCGFGPHNPEIHVACIECDRPADGEEHNEQRPSGYNYQNSQNTDTANAFLVASAATRNHST